MFVDAPWVTSTFKNTYFSNTMWYKAFTPGRRPTTRLWLWVPMGTRAVSLMGFRTWSLCGPLWFCTFIISNKWKASLCGCNVVLGSSGLRGGSHHDKEVLLLWQHARSSHQHRSAAEYSSIFPTINKAKREREKRPECLDEEGRGVGGKSQEVVGANKPLLW